MTGELTPIRSDSGSLSELLLVVDDDAWVRDAAQMFLERHGYRVLVAQDGQEGLEMLRSSEEPVALVVCDAEMPRMDAGEFLESLRARDPAVKFLVVSGHPSESLRRSEGFGPEVSILEKPLRGVELLTEVRKMLAQSGP